MTSPQLMPHQTDGVRLLAGAKRKMLAWDMRLGKTATALRAWDEVATEGPLLVLCPATARANWAREAATWCPEARVQVLWASSDRPDYSADIVITNYDKLTNKTFAQALRMWRSADRGVLVLDEMHYLKNPRAERTKRVYGVTYGKPDARIVPLIDRFDRIWGLTGTPMPNHPAELYSHCRALWPDAIKYSGHVMELWEYELRYCVLQQTEYGTRVVGGQRLDELKQRLVPYIHRLKSSDVMPHDLKLVETWPLDIGAARVTHDLPELVAKLQQRFGDVSEIERWDEETVDAYLQAINVEHDAVARVRRDVGTLKAVSTALLVREEIENNAPKTLVFAHHRDAIETLTKGLASCNPAVIHGDVPAQRRQLEIDRFHADPSCKVFIGQIVAAGQSIDLSAAEHIVFCEASWTPGENAQAMARASGPRQTKPVWVRFAYLAGSIDENILRACARKTAMINQLF
jgi:SWI/SNF-related matrix-associated actin-dependent regulator 1 of chromatin subfamily A